MFLEWRGNDYKETHLMMVQFMHIFNVCVGKLGLAQGNDGQYSH